MLSGRVWLSRAGTFGQMCPTFRCLVRRNLPMSLRYCPRYGIWITRFRVIQETPCFGALYSTHIVAPRTPNSHFALRDTLRLSSRATQVGPPNLFSWCSTKRLHSIFKKGAGVALCGWGGRFAKGRSSKSCHLHQTLEEEKKKNKRKKKRKNAEFNLRCQLSREST